MKDFLLTLFILSFCSCHIETPNWAAYKKAGSLYLHGQTSLCMEILEDLEKRQSYFALPFILDGRISLFNKDLDRAYEKLSAGLALENDNYDGNRWMSAVLINQGKFQEADKLLTRILELFPDSPHFILNLAKVRHETGDFKSSIVLYDSAFYLEKELALGHLFNAMNYSAFGMKDKYFSQLERAWELVHPFNETGLKDTLLHSIELLKEEN